MKTKDLIAALQEADPSGEEECCVGNCDICSVEVLPAYWDGCLQILIRDPNSKYNDVIGGKFVHEGDKIMISPYAISDLIFDRENIPIEYDGEYTRNKYEAWVESKRKRAKEIKNDVEADLFKNYMVRRLTQSGYEEFNEDEIKAAAIKFFKENLDEKDPFPEDIAKLPQKSWADKRYLQWDRELVAERENGELVINKVQHDQENI